jgi:hypothetical protein
MLLNLCDCAVSFRLKWNWGEPLIFKKDEENRLNHASVLLSWCKATHGYKHWIEQEETSTANDSTKGFARVYISFIMGEASSTHLQNGKSPSNWDEALAQQADAHLPCVYTTTHHRPFLFTDLPHHMHIQRSSPSFLSTCCNGRMK